MKKIKIILGLTFASIVGTLNFTMTEKSMTNNLSLRNLHTLQASAGEIYCDASDQTSCQIRISGDGGNDGIGYGTGNVRSIYP